MTLDSPTSHSPRLARGTGLFFSYRTESPAKAAECSFQMMAVKEKATLSPNNWRSQAEIMKLTNLLIESSQKN